MAEGLEFEMAEGTTSGYKCVAHRPNISKVKPYLATVRVHGKRMHLGSFVNAEAAALCYARFVRASAPEVTAADSELAADLLSLRQHPPDGASGGGASGGGASDGGQRGKAAGSSRGAGEAAVALAAHRPSLSGNGSSAAGEGRGSSGAAPLAGSAGGSVGSGEKKRPRDEEEPSAAAATSAAAEQVL